MPKSPVEDHHFLLGLGQCSVEKAICKPTKVYVARRAKSSKKSFNMGIKGLSPFPKDNLSLSRFRDLSLSFVNWLSLDSERERAFQKIVVSGRPRIRNTLKYYPP